jgi:signal transduction histidine kinase
VTGVVEVIRDATEKKLAEEQLIHNARLVSLGEAAAGIAHEVRSPLNAIKLGLQALDPFLKQDGEAREVASVINRNVERLAEFLSEMLLFARKDSGERAPGDLRRVVQNAVTLVEKQAQDQKVQIVTNFQKGVGPVRFNATHMQQVVHNILLNAIQAMPKGGKVEISVAQGAPQAGLLLRVADTGVGIPDKDKPRVFDPFYSSKPSGIGLGLAISSKIVKDHGGHIAVRDHKPRGTVVEVFLPEE